MNVFEDAGYFCVDNLPPEMIRALVELFVHEGSKVERAAVVSDVRGGDYFEALRARARRPRRRLGLRHRVLFLDADEQTLLNRYKETRRRHPLAPASSVAARHRLRARAARAAARAGRRRHRHDRPQGAHAAPQDRRRVPAAPDADAKLAVTFESFGFKHGPRARRRPRLRRALPAQPALRARAARRSPATTQRVVDYVGRDGRLDELYEHLEPLLDFLLPQYVARGQGAPGVAIGCTGGRHRSVAIAEHLAERYARARRPVRRGRPPRRHTSDAGLQPGR